MKVYETPEIALLITDECEIISTSLGLETPLLPFEDESWIFD